jgi:hypothetical protein
MIEVKSYRDLKVWQKSMDLVVICYQLTSKLPKTEIYGLTSQIQRIVARLAYLKDEELETVLNKCDEIGRMLHSLKEKLSQRKK